MIKAADTSKELSLELQKKGIDAHHVIAYEKGGSWFKRYTLDVVCRWLREVHKLFVEIRVSKNTFLWGYRVSLPNGRTSCLHANTFDTYEGACEDAIKYCLENLI